VKYFLVLAVKEAVGSVRHERLLVHIGGGELTVLGAAFEEGQRIEKRETAGTNINVLMDLINEGRTQVADGQEARGAADAQTP
jgi:hypothetical protein